MTRIALIVLGLGSLAALGIYLAYSPDDAATGVQADENDPETPEADPGGEAAGAAETEPQQSAEQPAGAADGEPVTAPEVTPEQAEQPGAEEEVTATGASSEIEIGEPRPEEPAGAAGEERYAELLKEAEGLEAKGRRSRAAALYEQALSVKPNGSEALSKLAFHHLNKGDNSAAADYAARAVVQDQTSSEAWIVLGAARDGLNDKQGAREAYRKCVELGKGIYVQECRRMIR